MILIIFKFTYIAQITNMLCKCTYYSTLSNSTVHSYVASVASVLTVKGLNRE